MDVPLQTLPRYMNVLSDYESHQETTLTIRYHDSIFKEVSAFDNAGQPLFCVEGTAFGISWSWRRRVWDSLTDQHLFNFRRARVIGRKGWVVKSLDGWKLCSLTQKWLNTKKRSVINATVRTDIGDIVSVIMRPNDHAATFTTVHVGRVTVAVIYQNKDKDATFQDGRDTTVWTAGVAARVDLSLASLLFSPGPCLTFVACLCD